ncbi:MAG: asparagine synthase (glutamine-hydrolyzing), partial [Candidatus Adiutrix sp.]|nr:asparagine synthase (glutamine-hydrolyzing) [Candidatus Adiutrix sp.]
MCGVFAWLPPPGGPPADLARAALAQFAALAERGPDDRGFATFDAQGRLAATERGPAPEAAGTPALLLGQTRLAIIDLSPAGHQPLRSPDGRYTLIFNGEIYNYLELRRELEAEGLAFRTRTDTEVLLAALARWGRAALNRLEGMFAFACFDARERKIFCARDVFGIKPLYWSQPGPGAFALASELPALLLCPGQDRRLDWPAAYNYLGGGIADVGDSCLVAGVRQLPPGHWLTVDLEGRIEGPEPYFKFALPEPLKISFDEAAEETRRLFLQSVRLHLQADVPLGVALSGGLDSTSVAYAVRHLQPGAVLKTFSYVAPGHALSEEPWVDLAAAGLEAETHKVSATPEELFRDLPHLIARLGEPFGSTSIYAQYRVFQLARAAGVVVTLEGQGADEMLAGYFGYTHLRLLTLLGRGCWRQACRVLENHAAWPGRSRFGIVKRLGRWMLPPGLKNPARAIDEGGLRRSWLNLRAVRDRGLAEWPPLSPHVPPSADKL